MVATGQQMIRKQEPILGFCFEAIKSLESQTKLRLVYFDSVKNSVLKKSLEKLELQHQRFNTTEGRKKNIRSP